MPNKTFNENKDLEVKKTWLLFFLIIKNVMILGFSGDIFLLCRKTRGKLTHIDLHGKLHKNTEFSTIVSTKGEHFNVSLNPGLS